MTESRVVKQPVGNSTNLKNPRLRLHYHL